MESNNFDKWCGVVLIYAMIFCIVATLIVCLWKGNGMGIFAGMGILLCCKEILATIKQEK